MSKKPCDECGQPSVNTFYVEGENGKMRAEHFCLKCCRSLGLLPDEDSND